MLTQAAATYTPAIFKMFQYQVLRTLNYDTLLCDESDTELKIYVVKFHGTQRSMLLDSFQKKKRLVAAAKGLSFLESLALIA